MQKAKVQQVLDASPDDCDLDAFIESLNSKIQWVKYTARGFRNRDNFKAAIYFHRGGLDLLPAT